MNATDLEKIELPSSVSSSVLKEIMKAIPVLSAFVSIADNYFMTYNTIMNMVDVLRNHEEQLSLLKEGAVNNSYRESAGYIRDILVALQKAKDELHIEKRKVFARYLTACCHIDNSKENNKDLYFDLIAHIPVSSATQLQM